MRLPDEPDLPFQINIVPMIDVIFAILTFFMMSSLFLTRSTGVPVNLPKAATAEAQNSGRFTVTVNAKGQIQLNNQTVSLSELKPRLQALVGTQPVQVIINADERVSHGQVVAVMDQLRQVTGVRLAIRATIPTGSAAQPQ
ncbi:MAG: biopolymer transporter ExbD [Leptolyngbyaceae cyanobacterium CAN_BIN12]|nr:biopolymer transporter ExbD [Leptolyngbyaceae cyanobacterium CAN_BIN12]